MILTTFVQTKGAYTTKDQIIDTSWENIASMLLHLTIIDDKEHMPLFCFWDMDRNGEEGHRNLYKDGRKTGEFVLIPNTIRRCKENATHLWAIVLDYDGDKTIEDAIAELGELEFILYTSFRHTPETHKFRVVIPFSKAAPKDVVIRKIDSIKETFPNVDNASFTMSHSFYFHSAPNALHARSHWNKGQFIDIDMFEDAPPPPPRAPVRAPTFTTDFDWAEYKKKMYESLITCSGLHYNGTGTKHHVLTLVSICKSAKMNFQEYDYICQQIMAPNSSLVDPKCRAGAWDTWPGNEAKKETREEFIKQHNGTSKFGIPTLSPKMQALKQKLEAAKAEVKSLEATINGKD
jgi:hypothetical protein